MNLPAKSGHEGIMYRAKKGVWRARVRIDRKMHEVGEFPTIEAAVKARMAFLARVGKLRERAA